MSQKAVICLLVLVACFQISKQCTCMWGYVHVAGENVPKSVCFGTKCKYC